MRRHNCTINDDRFIRGPGPRQELCRRYTEDTVTVHRGHRSVAVAYYYRENEGCLGRGMSSWPEMTITEDALKHILSSPSAINTRARGMQCYNILLTALLYQAETSTQ